MRGFGVTEASFAVEMQMDRVARELGLDPWELRLHHAYRNGDERPYRKSRRMPRWLRRSRRPRRWPGVSSLPSCGAMSSNDRDRRCGMTLLRGRGIAAVNYPTGMNLGGDPTQALVHATPTGAFVITLSSVDLGQGLKTVLAQIGAETLGVPFDTVMVDTADSDTGPHCMGTFASRATHRVGNAIIQAAEEARRAMLEVAAEELEAAPEDLDTTARATSSWSARPTSASRSWTSRWPRTSSTARRSRAAGST